MKKRGFTLVEIMIVVAIIGLLAAIAIPSFAKIRAESRKSTCANNIRLIRDAAEQYAMANNLTADATITTSDLSEYLKSGIPLCPEGNAAYSATFDLADGPTCGSGADGHAAALVIPSSP
jgi:type IV pilus assembly protein PilA